LPSQNREIVCRHAESIFEHARKNTQLDQAIAKAKNVRAGFWAIGRCERGSPRHFDATNRERRSNARGKHALCCRDQCDRAKEAKGRDVTSNSAGSRR
jgi:hypothetical protein